ncbi:MAG: NAD(P)/FAD-dependent oxidoreductase [Cyanobacteriota bacterium]
MNSVKDNKYFDIIIIGAGIVGAMIARILSKYKLNILIIEKEVDICMGASAANSAILHSGCDPKPGSLKAELNVKGNKYWKNIVNELQIPCKETGSFVIAIGEEELETIWHLYKRSIYNKVPKIKILRKDEILYKEPKLNPEVTGALWTPTTAVVDPFEATIAACENAINNGSKLLLSTQFKEFIIEKNKIVGIKTNNGDFYSRWVINSSGIYADEVMHKAGIRSDYKITPRRGEYLVFDESKVKLNTVLYPVPNKEIGKGTLISTTTHGNVMIGPNAEFIEDKASTETTKSGISEILKNAKRLLPSLNEKDVIAQYAGLRATSNLENGDFLIEISEDVQGLVNIGGIESPGFVSAPAIAEMIIELLKQAGEKFEEKENWNPVRKARPCFRKLSHLERAELIKKNPAYGRIVCRCEEVTEGEIVDAIHSPVPALTYDAVKRRTWLGTGRCQGCFDYPRVIEILARELNIAVRDVTKCGNNSNFIFRRTKDVEIIK